MNLLKAVNAALSNNLSSPNPQKNWYLVDSGPNNGSLNMAIDEYLATSVNCEVPILRFYQWQPYAISLGYNQRSADIDLEKCRQDKIDIVRRPTGGRAVLHAEEVTYAVIIPKPASDWFQNSTRVTYQFISQALVAGLAKLGLSVKLENRTHGNVAYAARTSAAIPCFTAAAQHEVMFQGKKLIGSAQRRFSSAILQHGSILLGDFHLKLPQYLKINNPKEQIALQQSLVEKTISISQILKQPISYREVVDAIVAGFSEQYHISFIKKEMKSQKHPQLERLLDKYQQGWR